MTAQLRRRVRYRLEHLLLRGAHVRLLLIARVVDPALFFFGALAWLGAPGFNTFLDV